MHSPHPGPSSSSSAASSPSSAPRTGRAGGASGARDDDAPPVARRRSRCRPGPGRVRSLLGSAAVVLVALVGGGVLIVLPSTQTEARTVQVTQQGQYSYTGAAESGTTYPSGVIGTGDTVWTKLARQVTVTFTNSVTGPELTGVRGTMRLDVSVTAADGWSAVVTSGPETALGNGTAAASVTVDPAAASRPAEPSLRRDRRLRRRRDPHRRTRRRPDRPGRGTQLHRRVTRRLHLHPGPRLPEAGRRPGIQPADPRRSSRRSSPGASRCSP